MDLSKLEMLLAERFRSERKRLNLSAESVAHFCKVSNSTVFNWEARKARIPLAAVAILCQHGLDIEALVRTETPEVHIALHPAGEGRTVAAPHSLLLRHGVHEATCMVYQCPSQIGMVMPAGELCLMGWYPTNRESLADVNGLFLFKSMSSDAEAFCWIEAAGKNLLRLSLNGMQKMVGQKQFITHFVILGEYKARLGYRPVSKDTGSVNLKNFIQLAEEAKTG